MCKRDRIINQIALMDEIRAKSNINIVTCGSCGDVLLQRLSDEEVECPYCSLQSDPCDFPDLFYTGMELSTIYNEDPETNCDFDENKICTGCGDC